MKKCKLNLMMAAVSAMFLVGVTSGMAQEFYPALVSAFSISTNSSGDLAYHPLRNRDIIRRCADDMGITNLEGLSLVYDRSADVVDVVSGTNQTVVCTPLTFSGGTALSNTNGTVTQRLAYVYYEGSTVANGTLLARQKLCSTTNGVSYFHLQGQLQFAVPDNGTNSPAIYLGNITAGSDLFPRFGRREGQGEREEHGD